MRAVQFPFPSEPNRVSAQASRPLAWVGAEFVLIRMELIQPTDTCRPNGSVGILGDLPDTHQGQSTVLVLTIGFPTPFSASRHAVFRGDPNFASSPGDYGGDVVAWESGCTCESVEPAIGTSVDQTLGGTDPESPFRIPANGGAFIGFELRDIQVIERGESDSVESCEASPSGYPEASVPALVERPHFVVGKAVPGGPGTSDKCRVDGDRGPRGGCWRSGGSQASRGNGKG